MASLHTHLSDALPPRGTAIVLSFSATPLAPDGGESDGASAVVRRRSLYNVTIWQPPPAAAPPKGAPTKKAAPAPPPWPTGWTPVGGVTGDDPVGTAQWTLAMVQLRGWNVVAQDGKGDLRAAAWNRDGSLRQPGADDGVPERFLLDLWGHLAATGRATAPADDALTLPAAATGLSQSVRACGRIAVPGGVLLGEPCVSGGPCEHTNGGTCLRDLLRASAIQAAATADGGGVAVDDPAGVFGGNDDEGEADDDADGDEGDAATDGGAPAESEDEDSTASGTAAPGESAPNEGAFDAATAAAAPTARGKKR